MSADRAPRAHAAPPAARYYVPPQYEPMLPPAARLRLLGFLSVLLSCAQQDARGDAPRLIVDVQRPDLAARLGVSQDTIRRLEEDLAKAGVLRRVGRGVHTRQLEILPPAVPAFRPVAVPESLTPAGRGGQVCPPLDPGAVALRAVDNSPPESLTPGKFAPPGGGTAAPPSALYTSSLGKKREEESRRARESGDCGKVQRPEPRVDFADRAAGRLGREVSDQLERAGTGPAYRLTRTQAAGVRAAVRRRLGALVGAGADEATAEALTRRDLERVLGYALQAARPAAHLATALRRDWRSHVPEGSEAARVAARGPAAERPVQDLDARQGPALRAWAAIDAEDDPEAAPSLECALARFRRAIDAAPLTRSQRARLRELGPTSPGEAIELAVQLERAAIAAQLTP